MIYEIQTEEEYQEGLKRFLEICSGPKDNIEEFELNILRDLLAKYELKNSSIN